MKIQDRIRQNLGGLIFRGKKNCVLKLDGDKEAGVYEQSVTIFFIAARPAF
jgi:hypothetical protein